MYLRMFNSCVVLFLKDMFLLEVHQNYLSQKVKVIFGGTK